MDFDKNLVNFFCQKIFGPGAMIVKKVGEFKNYPVVKLYKRLENNSLVSINDQIFDESIVKSK